MFFTKYSIRNRCRTCSGRNFEPKYKENYDKKGVRELIIYDKDLVYDKIQSFASDTDINKILARYFGGDISVIDKNKGFYTDISEIPTNFNDFHNKIVEGQKLWNGLPTDFKSEFNNDVNQFVNSIYEKDFEKKYNDYVDRKNNKNISVSAPASVPVSESEVKTNE